MSEAQGARFGQSVAIASAWALVYQPSLLSSMTAVHRHFEDLSAYCDNCCNNKRNLYALDFI